MGEGQSGLAHAACILVLSCCAEPCATPLPSPASDPPLLPFTCTKTQLQVDGLEGRFAQAVGYRGATPKEVMQRLSAQLGEIEAGLAPSPANGGGLQGKVKALAAAARLRAGAPGAGSAVSELEGGVDPAALDQLFGILSQYAEALGKMNEVLHRDERSVGILEHEYGSGSERG